MAPVPPTSGDNAPEGPHPSFIQVGKPYMFQQEIQSQLVAIGTNLAREDTYRLNGIQWINDVRQALAL